MKVEIDLTYANGWIIAVRFVWRLRLILLNCAQSIMDVKSVLTAVQQLTLTTVHSGLRLSIGPMTCSLL
jgi:hypothetical protein